MQNKFGSPADEYSGVDIGAQVNAAITNLPSTGGHIVIPAGNYSFSTQIVISKPVRLSGSLGEMNSVGTVLTYTGSGIPIVVNGAAAASNGSVLEHFDLVNGGTGTVGIDIYNGQYGVSLRDLCIEGTNFSIAAVRWGNTGGATINGRMERVRIAGGTVGLQVLTHNELTCVGCSIYNTTTANVQLGDASHFCTNVNFFGGNIEQDNSAVPNFIVNNTDSFGLYGVYSESVGGTHIQVPSTATNATGVRVYGGRLMQNSTAAIVLDLNHSSSHVVVDGLNVVGAVIASVLVKNTSSAFVNVPNIGSNVTFTNAITGTTTNVYGHYSSPALNVIQRI